MSTIIDPSINSRINPSIKPAVTPDISRVVDPARQTAVERNAQDLEQELDWFARLLDARFKLYFQNEPDFQRITEVVPPDLRSSRSGFADFIREYDLDFNERVAVVLALIPHLRPHLLDIFHTKNQNFERKFTEFGGVLDTNGDFLPTGETLVFIIGGGELFTALDLQQLFETEHVFTQHDLLRLNPQRADAPRMKGSLELTVECLGRMTTGQVRHHHLSADFPARHIETQLDWGDLVLHPGTLTQVREIEIWLRHGDTLMDDWAMRHKLRPGYRALFYGPPGTGKTMTACLLGKTTGRDVYKVDLSLVVSKYIGETEKNLARVFDQAQHKNWVLFFDEADALFGKRGATQNANDRHANQEVSFLLQRIETFDGIAILASNLKDNLDSAFARRFESIIYFPVPRYEERLRLWRQGFSSKAQLEETVDLVKIAKQYELGGGSIMNVVRYASLQALEKGDNLVTHAALLRGIRREQVKDGKGV
jgi:AAA+ superfamily predicted ATPase